MYPPRGVDPCQCAGFIYSPSLRRSTQLVLHMRADDLIKRRFRQKTQIHGATRVETTRDGCEHRVDRRIEHVANQPTADSPAARRSASICSPTVADTPGIIRLRRTPKGSRSIAAA